MLWLLLLLLLVGLAFGCCLACLLLEDAGDAPPLIPVGFSGKRPDAALTIYRACDEDEAGQRGETDARDCPKANGRRVTFVAPLTLAA